MEFLLEGAAGKESAPGWRGWTQERAGRERDCEQLGAPGWRRSLENKKPLIPNLPFSLSSFGLMGFISNLLWEGNPLLPGATEGFLLKKPPEAACVPPPL